ncbi:transposase [Sphingobium xenophagum]|uniref:Transposase n=1 Tax=Sphingobium xenophagum TaxID=121428 RepID=A0ABU1X6G4_SPHXE|nr:transposase [Sphingobium xenophagum]
MGQILHGSARTTEAVRRAIQHSQESLRILAKRYCINQKTVAKWKRRTAVKDLPTGPKDAHSTVLSLEDEAIIVAFRKHRDCQDFRVWPGIMGNKESHYVTTQRACHTE